MIRDSRCGRASIGERSALQNAVAVRASAVAVRASAVVSCLMLFECCVLYGRSLHVCEAPCFMDTVSCSQSFEVEVAKGFDIAVVSHLSVSVYPDCSPNITDYDNRHDDSEHDRRYSTRTSVAACQFESCRDVCGGMRNTCLLEIIRCPRMEFSSFNVFSMFRRNTQVLVGCVTPLG